MTPSKDMVLAVLYWLDSVEGFGYRKDELDSLAEGYLDAQGVEKSPSSEAKLDYVDWDTVLDFEVQPSHQVSKVSVEGTVAHYVCTCGALFGYRAGAEEHSRIVKAVI